jgi:hypothetical protein
MRERVETKTRVRNGSLEFIEESYQFPPPHPALSLALAPLLIPTLPSPSGLLTVEYLIKRDRERLLEPRAGLSSRRAEIFPRQVSPNSYREILTEIKRQGIYNLIVDIKHLPLFFRIVSSPLWRREGIGFGEKVPLISTPKTRERERETEGLTWDSSRDNDTHVMSICFI